ncbi:MAG: hypothetical protein E7585_08045 [Ruminococcaceae bacterium]|nr:hypothetical protein [Oscillospiraceae bacterium]
MTEHQIFKELFDLRQNLFHRCGKARGGFFVFLGKIRKELPDSLAATEQILAGARHDLLTGGGIVNILPVLLLIFAVLFFYRLAKIVIVCVFQGSKSVSFIQKACSFAKNVVK